MKKLFLVFMAVAFLAFPSFAKDTIKLGLIAPLTGDVKTFGESAKNGFIIAIEDYSKSGKYKIDPVIADDRNDPTEGANAALKLITQDKVIAISGPLTSRLQSL